MSLYTFSSSSSFEKTCQVDQFAALGPGPSKENTYLLHRDVFLLLCLKSLSGCHCLLEI